MFPVIHTGHIIVFSLILIRVSVYLVTWPLFGESSVPALLKILFALTLTMLLMPVIKTQLTTEELESLAIIWLALREALIGMALGFISRGFFYVVEMTGQLISISIGLSSAQILNPTVGSQVTALEQFQVVIASLFFLAINGHHSFLTGLSESFEILPISSNGISFLSFQHLVLQLQDFLGAALRMASPVIASILFVNIAMGIMGRVVPQINVLITSWSVNIIAGIAIILLSLPFFVDELSNIFEMTLTLLMKSLRES